MEKGLKRVHTSCCACGMFPSLHSHHSSLSPFLHSPPAVSNAAVLCGCPHKHLSQILSLTHTVLRVPLHSCCFWGNSPLWKKEDGGSRSRKKVLEKLMSPEGSQQVAKDWDISHLAKLVCVCVCPICLLCVLVCCFCSFIRRLHSLLHNKLIMFLFTADRAGGVMRADGATQET